MAYYIDTFPGREIIVNGKKHLYFGGTAYLGLQTNNSFQQIYIKNILKYGTCYGASRKANVRFSIYAEAEKQLAKLVGSEASITVSSGYLASQLVRKAFHQEGYTLFHAPKSHPSLFLASDKTYATFTALDIAIREHLGSKATSTPVVFMDTIDFFGCNYPSFEELKTLPLKDLIVVADDSHGLGIVGKNGSGCHSELLALAPKELIVCGSLGKGWGIQGGAIFGGNNRISQFMDTNLFGGASPATPSSIATFLEAQIIYHNQREVLKRNRKHFISNLKTPKRFLYNEGHPAFSYSNKALTDHMESHHIIVTNFPYPSKDAALMSRIVISAHHTEKDIDHLTSLVNSF